MSSKLPLRISLFFLSNLTCVPSDRCLWVGQRISLYAIGTISSRNDKKTPLTSRSIVKRYGPNITMDVHAWHSTDFTRNQFNMYSFVSQSWCAFWQKNDMLLTWFILKSTSKTKPQRKAYHLKDTALLCVFKILFVPNPMICFNE